jgi:hypothetical protein
MFPSSLPFFSIKIKSAVDLTRTLEEEEEDEWIVFVWLVFCINREGAAEHAFLGFHHVR